MDERRWLTVRAAAVRLGESERTVRRLVAARRLTVRRGGATGRRVLISAASLDAYERTMTTPARTALVSMASGPTARPTTGAVRHGKDCAPRICSVCRAARAAR